MNTLASEQTAGTYGARFSRMVIGIVILATKGVAITGITFQNQQFERGVGRGSGLGQIEALRVVIGYEGWNRMVVAVRAEVVCGCCSKGGKRGVSWRRGCLTEGWEWEEYWKVRSVRVWLNPMGRRIGGDKLRCVLGRGANRTRGWGDVDVKDLGSETVWGRACWVEVLSILVTVMRALGEEFVFCEGRGNVGGVGFERGLYYGRLCGTCAELEVMGNWRVFWKFETRRGGEVNTYTSVPGVLGEGWEDLRGRLKFAGRQEEVRSRGYWIECLVFSERRGGGLWEAVGSSMWCRGGVCAEAIRGAGVGGWGGETFRGFWTTNDLWEPYHGVMYCTLKWGCGGLAMLGPSSCSVCALSGRCGFAPNLHFRLVV
ncbi:hypothetical protein Tco_0977152 [Tanacetum coccineum]|uniref:Uncharacterized protein n=1 Tax=Tanacetum coccineum TaxID=301880 RepID=A0ABQ5EJA5_9ASTR